MKKIFVIFVLLILCFGCKEQLTPLKIWSLDQMIFSASYNDNSLALLLEDSIKILSVSEKNDADKDFNVGKNIEHGEILFDKDNLWIGDGSLANGILFSLNIPDGSLYQFNKEKYAEVYAISLLENKNLLATGHGNGEIILWDLITNKKKRCFGDYDTEVCTLLFSHDGKALYSGDAMGAITLWDVESGRKIQSKKEENSAVYTLCFNKKTQSLIAGGVKAKGMLYIYDNGLSIQKNIKVDNKGAVLSCDSQVNTGKIICGLTDGYVAISEYNGSNNRIFKLHKDDVLFVKFVDQGRKMVTVSKDGVIKLWDAGLM
jgi:WD40 repeat protein